jgi:hypothetical protein
VVKQTSPTFTEDDAREAILKLLYDRWKNPRGIDSSKVKISEIKSSLKQKGIDAKVAIRNLQYLVETNWVKRNVKEFRVNTGRFSIPSQSSPIPLRVKASTILKAGQNSARKQAPQVSTSRTFLESW